METLDGSEAVGWDACSSVGEASTRVHFVPLNQTRVSTRGGLLIRPHDRFEPVLGPCSWGHCWAISF